jgi:CxxC-x17-CxxC domain-containing protein
MAKNMSRNRNNDRRDSNNKSFDNDFSKGFGGLGFRDRPMRESFKAVCSECGANCDLPFKPSQDRPVYCRDCFQKHKK